MFEEEDDKVKHIVNPLLFKINVGRRRWQGGKISDDSQYTDAGAKLQFSGTTSWYLNQ